MGYQDGEKISFDVLDTHLQLDDPLEQTITRAKKYAASGADGIFVPGVSRSDDIKLLVESIEVPLNSMSLKQLTCVEHLNTLGVKRLSIGNALSDATIYFIEQQAHTILNNQSTACLYNNHKVQTIFT